VYACVYVSLRTCVNMFMYAIRMMHVCVGGGGGATDGIIMQLCKSMGV
jgi:hypothetical protein